MNNPGFTSDLAYSVQNEDYRSELAVLTQLGKQAPARVLMIASSGENALSLLTQEEVACVDAVDLNPAQIQLCELRRIAIDQLSRDEQLRLLGTHPTIARAGDEAARLDLYDRLRPYLPDSTRAFWDARRQAEVAFGIQHVGRNDRMMHELHERLLVAGFRPLEYPLTEEQLPAWRQIYIDLVTPSYMQTLFRLPNLEIASKASHMAPILGETHFRALQQPLARHNPLLTTVFADSYALDAGEDGYPCYLQKRGQAALRQLGVADRLRLHPGNMLELMPRLAAEHKPFDLISISNIADWMNATQFEQVVRLASSCLVTGGALLARTATGSQMIQDVIAASMRIDPALHTRLVQSERGPWFRTIAVGFAA